MPHLSFWEKETFLSSADFTIIGSGIVGLNTAIALKEKRPSSRVVIVERGFLPIGASSRNAGFACFGSMTELMDDLENQSEKTVWALVEKRWRGLQRLRERVGDDAMQFQNLGGYELFNEAEKSIFHQCKERLSYFNQQLQKVIGVSNVFEVADDKISDFGFGSIKHLIWNRAEGQIHTGKMLQKLVSIATQKGIQILNGIAIEGWETEGNKLKVFGQNGFEITTDKLALCTNGFTKKLLPEIDLQPARNQVLVTKPIPNLKVRGTFHYNQGYVYFRHTSNRIILGGFRHLNMDDETTDKFGFSIEIQQANLQFLKEVILPYQKTEVDSWWSGIMGVGTSKSPIVTAPQSNLFVAARLGGMGVAIGSLVGEELAELMG